jgi:hypothetical protein
MRVPKYREVPTPVELERKRRRFRSLLILVLFLLAVFLWLSYAYSPSRPTTYADDEEHFKYGSVGSDIENGLPMAILRVMPRMFPKYMPEGAPPDLTAFGFIQEPGATAPSASRSDAASLTSSASTAPHVTSASSKRARPRPRESSRACPRTRLTFRGS